MGVAKSSPQSVNLNINLVWMQDTRTPVEAGSRQQQAQPMAVDFCAPACEGFTSTITSFWLDRPDHSHDRLRMHTHALLLSLFSSKPSSGVALLRRRY